MSHSKLQSHIITTPPPPSLSLSLSQPFGEDHEKQYIYKEPAVTTLAEIVLRLQKLYSRKFGPGTPVNIIQESGRVSDVIMM